MQQWFLAPKWPWKMKFWMFTILQTLRTHCLHFKYDVSNVPSHTEHVKRSLETSKIEKKAKICWFSGFAPVTTRKNRKVQLSRRGSNIWQNPFNSIFVNLNANLNETSKSKRGLGEENFDFLCFFGPHRSQKRSTGRKKKYKNTSWAKTAATEGKIFLGS